MNYSDFQNLESSSKLSLAVLEAGKQIIGFSVHSGSVYKLENFDISVITSIEEEGIPLSEVSSIGSIVPGTFYNDRSARTLYIEVSDSTNPNGKFLSLVYKLFFSNAGISLPWDLNTGFDVFWEPLIRSVSRFGVEIDTVNQISEAIEGSGKLSLFNDRDFWPANYDKLFFDNQRCWIYSYNENLPSTEAKLLFKGRIVNKSYTQSEIQFSLSDILAELRVTVDLPDVESISGRPDAALLKAKQRMIFGRLNGFRPVNIDAVNDGYPLTGTVSATSGTAIITGSGTIFLTECNPDDEVILGGQRATIASVNSNTQITLSTEPIYTSSVVNQTLYILPARGKKYMNRLWKVSSHELRQPSVTVISGSTITRLMVTSTQDMFEGDSIIIGGTERAIISRVINSNLLTLTTSLLSIPANGTSVVRPAIQNLRMNDIQLINTRDFTVDAANGTITILEDAELNAGPEYRLSTTLTFTSGSRSVSGPTEQIKSGDYISIVGQGVFAEVLSIDSESALTIRSNSTFTGTAAARVKSFIFNPQTDVLSCNVLGRTDNGLSTGNLLRTAPKIVEQLLIDQGLDYDASSITEASSYAAQDIGIAIPTKYDETESPLYRDVINQINKSVFGNLIQNDTFQLSYQVLRPTKSIIAKRLDESDTLEIKVDSTNENMISRAEVIYDNREYDYVSKTSKFSLTSKTSDIASKIVKTDRIRRFSSLLVNQDDAQILVNRWAFLLELSTARIEIVTKLQAIDIQVTDVIDISHPEFYERLGGSLKRKIVLVEKVEKSERDVQIIAVDLSNAFNRVANYTDQPENWDLATDEQKLFRGFYTDEFGLINNDIDSHLLNVYW